MTCGRTFDHKHNLTMAHHAPYVQAANFTDYTEQAQKLVKDSKLHEMRGKPFGASAAATWLHGVSMTIADGYGPIKCVSQAVHLYRLSLSVGHAVGVATSTNVDDSGALLPLGDVYEVHVASSGRLLIAPPAAGKSTIKRSMSVGDVPPQKSDDVFEALQRKKNSERADSEGIIHRHTAPPSVS